jgi:hypothetical protein
VPPPLPPPPLLHLRAWQFWCLVRTPRTTVFRIVHLQAVLKVKEKTHNAKIDDFIIEDSDGRMWFK